MSVELSKEIRIVENARKLNTKASEEYVHVEFTYENPKTVLDYWIPVEYRRTGVSIKPDDEEQLYSYLNKVYTQLNPANYDSWLKKQDEYWASSRSDVTKPIFDTLKDGKWHCRNYKLLLSGLSAEKKHETSAAPNRSSRDCRQRL